MSDLLKDLSQKAGEVRQKLDVAGDVFEKTKEVQVTPSKPLKMLSRRCLRQTKELGGAAPRQG